MGPLAIAAAVAVVGGGLLVAGAARRLALVTGVLLVLVMLPLTGRAFPTTAGWSVVAYLHLAATLLGALFLWIGLRPSGVRLDEPPGLGRRSWLVLVGAAGIIGVAAWPLLVEALDPSRTFAVRETGWLDPARWALGAGLAAITAALSQLLDSVERPRLAAGAALGIAGTWLVVVSTGAPTADVALISVSLVLPIAAAVTAWQTVRRR